MNRRAFVAVAILSAALSVPVRAATPARGTQQSPDVKAMIERNKRCMREASAHAAKVTFGRADVEKYLTEWQSFDALYEDEESKDPSGPMCLDLDTAVKDPKYVAWARSRRVEPKAFLLKSMRIALTYAGRRAPQQAAEMKAALDAQRREFAVRCESMGPNACRDLERGFADSDAMMRETSAMMALFPKPTAAEASLLAEYDGRLRETMEGQPRRHRAGEMGGPGPDGEDAPMEGDDAR